MFVIALLFSACGRNNKINTDDVNNMNICNISEDIDSIDNLLNIRNLSILVYDEYETYLRLAYNQMRTDIRNLPMDERFELLLDIETFSSTDRWNRQLIERLQVRKMAGQAHDIIISDTHIPHSPGTLPIWQWAQAGIFTDIYALMDSDSRLSRSDFFLQPLSAWEMPSGRLYTLPIAVNFTYILINAKTPSSIIDNFSSYNSISIPELLDIYLDLIKRYEDDFGHFGFLDGDVFRTSSEVMWIHLGEFIDFDNKTTNIADNRFIEFLINLRAAYAWVYPEDRPWSVRDGRMFYSWMGLPPRARAMAHEVAFIGISSSTPAFTLFEHYEMQYFLHGIPLTDSNGRLFIDMPHRWNIRAPMNLSISATADTALAWEFSKHLINRVNNTRQAVELVIPILREDYTRLTTSGLNAFLTNYTQSDSSLMNHYMPQIPYALSRLAELAEMPMTRALPPVPVHFWQNDYDLFWHGVIRADEFAQRLHNRITLWLIE